MKHIINEFLEFVDKHSQPVNESYKKSYSLEDLEEYIEYFLEQYKGGWIPVEKGLPDMDEGDVVLVTASGNPHKNVTLIDAIEIAMYDDETGKWILERYPKAEITVTAWQPLPEPYEGGEEL